MRNKVILLVIMFYSATILIAQNKQSIEGYPTQPVPFTDVKIAPQSFWGQRIDASRKVTIPLAFSKCEESGRYDNFIKAAHPSDKYEVKGFPFDDTDVYKTIEGASYLLQTFPDKKLEQYMDSVLTIVAGAQEPDGYLYTPRTMNPKHPHEWSGDSRWVAVENLSHEFYNLGHMVEGAIAHYQATGKRTFLDIAIRYADCVCNAIGNQPGQLVMVPGHQIAEMALAKLYLTTGNKKYLDEAKFFLDKRGYTSRKDSYSQAHKPVIEQDEAVGHAVRAVYMYSGMADVAALTGDKQYINAIDKIWDNIVSKKFYITGGIGATNIGEAFGDNYMLPNMSAYCETCAAIGNVYLNHRLFLLHGDSKYYDVLERTLYNGLISGVSLDGGEFFYPNPLQSMGQHQRQAWFGCACCPSNICRFIPSLPGYIYATKDNSVFVNLFASNKSSLRVMGKDVILRQETDYPWNGDIKLTIEKTKITNFNLKIRIPGWVRGSVVPGDLYYYSDGVNMGYQIYVNGEEVKSDLQNGYFNIQRNWKKGDVVSIHFDMTPRTVKTNQHVQADKGRVAVERGPIVYCAEWADNTCNVLSTLINQKPLFTVTDGMILNYPIKQIKTHAQSFSYAKDGRLLSEDVELTLIPYYAWAHRGTGNMAVWLPQEASALTPDRIASLTAKGKLTAQYPNSSLPAVCDGKVPTDENDRSLPFYKYESTQMNGTTWLTYRFVNPIQVNSCTLYWYDEAPWGNCRVPASWKILYEDKKGEWREVRNANDYRTEKGCANKVSFETVETGALKLELIQDKTSPIGIFEWEVD